MPEETPAKAAGRTVRVAARQGTAAVIPAFNESKSIGAVVRSVAERGLEPLVVDDGSKDDTSERARSAGATVLRHPINRGYGAALTTGSQWALRHGYQVIVHFDADGQHDANEIEALIRPIENGDADVVVGSRFLSEGQSIPLPRKLFIKLAVLFTRVVSGVSMTDAHNGFRAISSFALHRLNCREDGMAYASEVIERAARQGLRLLEVPVTVTYSDYSMAKGEGNLAKFRVGLRFLWAKLIE